MAKWEFYDEDEEAELSETDSEPSFSFYDFKKWLSKEKRHPSREETPTEMTGVSSKEELKEMFKNRVKKKVQQNIDKKMEDRASD
jgi:hypothetical protein